MAGAAAGGVALAVSELAAGIAAGLPSLISGVATFVIDNVPPPVKDFAIELFGTADKVALAVGIVVTTLGLGYVAGLLFRRSSTVVPAVFAGFGLLGALAAARTPQADLYPAFLNGALAAAAGIFTFALVVSPVSRAARQGTDLDRRVFLGRAGAVVALAVIGAGAGRALFERTRRLIAGRDEVVLPIAGDIAPPVPAGAMLDVPGISQIITPNAEFYRIDTAPISPPTVDLATWTMSITGMVDRPITLDFTDLSDMAMVERVITIACVSNQVGGDLIGTAKWLGTPLGDLLRRAGVRPEATQVVGRSVDGFTVGFPTAAVFDGWDALLAIGMNDEPLPFEHGFPARLIVAGLYGYVSATKWLSEIELTTWDAFDAYWVPRGWSKEGPIKTQSRIDTPRRSARLAPGPVGIGGVAWAQTRGIERVEVRIDGGEWRDAELGEAIGDDVWRQWSVVWDATPGTHQAQCRATDGHGETQTEQITSVAPNGATGFHTVTYLVDEA
ncbi:MAG TPA: molybdopterin-dependent oxidoreductase [Acidimicrobiia bacterium]|nr:molybdopterin-dependent oxidoreductase [Acidimicrobiia bacterium]